MSFRTLIKMFFLFESVVEIVFQSVFRLKMYLNNIFFIFKFFFNISTSKRSKNIKKINLKLKKIEKHGWTAMLNEAYNLSIIKILF